jgi:glyoxylase-like metal-dependent hydrolase (beta-lactamase superfamily II)
MARLTWQVLALAFMIGTAPMVAQERIDWNAKMPWGALEKAVQARWADLPRTAQKAEPFKIFDNLYFVGVQHVAAYLVPTTEGLILIDATYANTADLVLDSIRQLGFDPANIRYIVITHEHFDHFAGVGRVKQAAPKAQVATSAVAWGGIEKLQSDPARADANGLRLTRDRVIAEGDTITLGDSVLKFYMTPGHSPGAIGVELNARHAGKVYRIIAPCVGLLNVPPAMTNPYIASMERLKQLGPWDGVFASHAFLTPRDPYITPRDFILGPDLSALAKRPHPALQGPAVISQWFDDILRVARDKLNSERAPS